MLDTIDENILIDVETAILKKMVPMSCASLSQHYQNHVDGQNIDIELKHDQTPASLADRNTEKILRDFINNKFPDHGILGEEYGGENLDRDFVWVLDPLDGTREFLAKKDHRFANLIALCFREKPIMGAVTDPLSKNVTFAGIKEKRNIAIQPLGKKTTINIEDAIIYCTSPDTMFPDKNEHRVIKDIQQKSKQFVTGFNALGYAAVIQGKADVSIERDLSFHDIAAIIPPARAAGLAIKDLDNQDFSEKQFDMMATEGQKYSFIISRCPALADTIISRMNNL